MKNTSIPNSEYLLFKSKVKMNFNVLVFWNFFLIMSNHFYVEYICLVRSTHGVIVHILYLSNNL